MRYVDETGEFALAVALGGWLVPLRHVRDAERAGPGRFAKLLVAMPSPFPGMDPYLEHPTLWPDVHARLIVELGRALGPRLSPRFVVRVEERTYLDPEGLVFVRPDVSVKDTSSPSQPGQRGSVDPVLAHVVAVEVPMPDHVRETWLEARSVPAGEVVTVLEILSPANSARAKGAPSTRSSG